MNIRSFFDRVFFFSLLSPVKASTLDKLTEPKDMITGVVKNINEGWMNSIVLQLEAEDRTFYINRGIEKGLNVNSMRSRLAGKQVTISVSKSENLHISQPIPISQIIVNKEMFFTDI